MRALFFLVTASLASPLHVEMRGIVTRINVDSLGTAYSDSVGLKVGSEVAFSVDLDYALPPILLSEGIADTLPGLDYPNPADSSAYTHNFRFAFSGTRFAQSLFHAPSSVLGDHGVIQYSPAIPTEIELSSNRQWNDSVSWVDLIFPAPDGMLTDSSRGQGQEELLIARTFERDAATLLVCAFDITRVSLSTPASPIRSDAGKGSLRRIRADKDRERGALRLNDGWFSINGRRRPR